MVLATALLIAILTLTASVLNHARRSQASAREAAQLSTARDEILSTFQTALEAMVFTQHAAFRDGSAKLEYVSDQHFVCGPSRSLLPETSGLCGDAIFFQRQNRDGATEATGFLVQYSDGRAWQPSSLPNLKPRWRFRLLQFQQPPEKLALYHTVPFESNGSEVFGFPLTPSREAAGQWFKQPLRHPGAQTCRVAAENVIAFLIETGPATFHGWDSREPPPEGQSGASPATQHRLPRGLSISFLTVSESAWNRLEEREARDAARDLLAIANTDRAARRISSRQILQRLGEILESRSLHSELVTLAVPLPRTK
jgi:uncharacterized protein (TIGR02599 family)